MMKPQKYWTTEEDEEIKRLTYQGEARKDIAFALGVTAIQVRNRVIKMRREGKMRRGKTGSVKKKEVTSAAISDTEQHDKLIKGWLTT